MIFIRTFRTRKMCIRGIPGDFNINSVSVQNL